MTRRAATFRVADVTRACKGVIAAGLVPKSTSVDQDGKIIIVFMDDKSKESGEPLNRWLERKNAKAE